MIKGILFDKDGTLIDFNALWLAAARWVIPEFIGQLDGPAGAGMDLAIAGRGMDSAIAGRGMDSAIVSRGMDDLQLQTRLQKELLEALGVFGDNIDSKGALAWKTYGEMAVDLNVVLRAHSILVENEWVEAQISRLFDQYIQGPEAVFCPVTDLKRVMGDLKDRGLIIGLATADTKMNAHRCLKHLGIDGYFDYIGADDGVLAPKPQPDIFMDFAGRFHLQPSHIAVVGDTWNDMFFARRCQGLAIGVLSGTGGRGDLEPMADHVLESVGELPGLFL